jgi:hypothetical protein
MAQEHDKAELIAELARARTIVSANFLALRHDLDFPARAKKAFKSSPLPWLGAAGVIGLIIARLPRRTKKVVTVFPKFKKKEEAIEKAGKAGLLLGALKIAFDFARPMLLKWVTQRVSDYASSATAQPRNYPRP